MERNYVKSVNTGTKTISVKLFLCTMLICISVGTLILGICFLVIKPKTEPIIDYLYDDSDLPEYDGLIYTQVVDGYCVNAKDKTAEKVIIPAEYNGLPVVKISDNAFSDSESLTSVTIPDSVTHIGKYAFKNCPIIKATIPAFAISAVVGDLAEENGKLLGTRIKNIIITSGTEIPSKAFLFCDNLTTISIPKTITTIGEDAFNVKPSKSEYPFETNFKNNYCPLAEIRYAGNIKTWLAIDGLNYLMSQYYSNLKLFINDKELKGELVVPAGVSSIGAYAFHNCTSLTSVVIPNSVNVINNSAFSGCNINKIKYTGDIKSWCSIKGLGNLMLGCTKQLFINDVEIKGELIIPNNVNSISGSAFYGCTNLTSVEIPSSVLNICDSAFSCCKCLSELKIPSNVINIGDFAFSDCVKLNSVIIPDGVISMGKSVFDKCDLLTIKCETPSQPSTWDKDWNGDNRPVIWGYQPE